MPHSPRQRRPDENPRERLFRKKKAGKVKKKILKRYKPFSFHINTVIIETKAQLRRRGGGPYGTFGRSLLSGAFIMYGLQKERILKRV